LESINKRERVSYLHLFFNIIEYPFVKGYLVGIIDRSNLQQKNHGRKISAKIMAKKKNHVQKNHDNKIMATKSRQKNHNRTAGSRIMAATTKKSQQATKSRQQNHSYRNRSIIDPQLQEEKGMVFICVVLNL
jgi:hypothetical protein